MTDYTGWGNLNDALMMRHLTTAVLSVGSQQQQAYDTQTKPRVCFARTRNTVTAAKHVHAMQSMLGWLAFLHGAFRLAPAALLHLLAALLSSIFSLKFLHQLLSFQSERRSTFATAIGATAIGATT